MILENDITEWYTIAAPWPNMEQVEHDLLLSRAICELYNSPVIANDLVFRGGTALHKLYFEQAGRFSEDLDFVQREQKPIGQTIDTIRAILDPWLGKPSWKQGEGRFTLYYRFETETIPVAKRKLKIEINTRALST
jgi:predicted nucleotidyltransferase component of viral defense system